MDTKTGLIYDAKRQADKKRIEELNTEEPGRVVPMKLAPTEKQMRRVPPSVGRNDICPCGSGKKFKKCCLQR